MNLVYLATPYSHKDPEVRRQRVQLVTKVAAELTAQGICVFSPITHNDPLVATAKLPTGWDFWREHDSAFLRRCARLIVLQLPGWETSQGVTAEIELAKELGIPIDYIPASAAGKSYYDGKIRLLKTCRLKPDRGNWNGEPPKNYPKKRAIYETVGTEMIDGVDHYRLRLIGTFDPALTIGEEIVFPIEWFNDTCEWVDFVPYGA